MIDWLFLWLFIFVVDNYPFYNYLPPARHYLFISYLSSPTFLRTCHIQSPPTVSAAFQTEPWWVHERGHNDVLKGNEHEFFRRMISYLGAVEKQQQQQQQQQQQPQQPSVVSKSGNKLPVREPATSSDEIRRTSTVKSMKTPSETDLRQASKRPSPTNDDKVESNEILLTMDMAPQRI